MARDKEILLIEMQAVVQQMRIVNCQAELDLHRGGEWRFDYTSWIRVCEDELNAKIKEYESKESPND